MPATQEAEARGSQVQTSSMLQSKLRTGLRDLVGHPPRPLSLKRGLKCCSVVECLPRMWKALGSLSSTRNQKNTSNTKTNLDTVVGMKAHLGKGAILAQTWAGHSEVQFT